MEGSVSKRLKIGDEIFIDFKKTCELIHEESKIIYDKLKRKEDVESNMDRIACLFADLKRINRETCYGTKSIKKETQESKQTMDRIFLTLQNLSYEKLNFLKEIQRCSETRTTYQNLDIIEIFDSKNKDPNKIMEERLIKELEERKRLVKELEECKKQVVGLENSVNEKEKSLSQMKSSLKDLSSQAELIRSQLHPELYSQKLDPKRFLLPEPLYSIYALGKGYEENSNESVSFEMVDCPQKEVESTYSSSSYVIEMKVKRENILKDELTVLFRYLTNLKLVVVSIRQQSKIIEKNILSNVFPGDNGKTSPIMSHGFLENGTFKFDHKLAGGYPYLWAQVIGGIKLDNLQNEEICYTFSNAISGIKSRCESYFSLHDQIEALKFSKTISIQDDRFPQLSSRISSWEEKQCEKGREFTLTVHRHSTSKIQAQVFIDEEYPVVFPFFKLTSETISVNNLESIENEINYYIEEMINEKNSSLVLTLQIKRLQMCLDVYYETDKKDTLFPRPIRGRDRTRPYKFDNKFGLTHRNLGTLS